MAEIPQKTAIGKLDENFIADNGVISINYHVIPKWLEVTGFTATPASTSTITMTEDWTGVLNAGTPVMYSIGGVYYYGIITAITSVLITIAGAPLSGDITVLKFSDKSRVCQVDFFIKEKFADGANATLLIIDMFTSFKWTLPEARLVKFTAKVQLDDSGATQPKVNVTVGGNAVCTSNTNAGLAVAETAVSTVVDINVTNYIVLYGADFEISTDASGTNKDASHLTVSATLVVI